MWGSPLGKIFLSLCREILGYETNEPRSTRTSFSNADEWIVVQFLNCIIDSQRQTFARISIRVSVTIIHLVLTNWRHNIGTEMELQSNCIRGRTSQRATMSKKSTSRRLFGSKAVFGAILLLVTYFGAAAVHAVKEKSSILVNVKSDDSYNNNYYIGNSVDRRSRLLMHREKHSRRLLSTDEVKQQELDQEANERERMLRGVKGPRKDKLGEKTSDAVLVDDIEDDMDVMYGRTQGKKKKRRKKKTGLYDVDEDKDGCVCVEYEYEYELLAGKSGKSAKAGKSQKAGKTKSTKYGGEQCIKYSCIEEVQ